LTGQALYVTGQALYVTGQALSLQKYEQLFGFAKNRRSFSAIGQLVRLSGKHFQLSVPS